MSEPFYIVFSGPPGPEGPTFIEVEDAEGRGLRRGEWKQRDDGYWTLGPFVEAPRSLDAVGEWMQYGHQRRLQIELPPDSGADAGVISIDGVPQTKITRLEFDMRPNELVTVRLERIGDPPQLSDTGGLVLDAYLYERRLDGDA